MFIKINILLVEDNPADANLIREKLEGSNILHELYIVPDGMEAMAFLRKEGNHNGALKPDIILLDLNLPRMDGREVLAEIKADPTLRRIPVVILTSSRADEDVIKSYDLHANAYVTKPVDLASFGRVVNAIENFWFSVVHLPPTA